MDKLQEKERAVVELRNQLIIVQAGIDTRIKEINKIKAKLGKAYRHHDKEMYEKERREIEKDLRQYEFEMDKIKAKITEIEAR